MISCQVSNNAPPPEPQIFANGAASQLLSRSKSLNDISNDSQISVFASDRFINLHKNSNNYGGASVGCSQQQQQHLRTQDHNGISTTIATTPTATTTCMPNINPYIYNQQNSNNVDNIQHYNHISNFTNSNVYDAITNPLYNDNLRNLNSIQCSRQPQQQPPLTPPQLQTATNANVFNLCSPLTAMNLNGVTEQIGNLHL